MLSFLGIAVPSTKSPMRSPLAGPWRTRVHFSNQLRSRGSRAKSFRASKTRSELKFPVRKAHLLQPLAGFLAVGGMVRAFEVGALEQEAKDPVGPKWLVKKIVYPTHKAAHRHFLFSKSLMITRTYALDAEPYLGRLPHINPALFNRVFADCVQRTKLTDCKLETLFAETPKLWRKAFYDGVKDWEEEPPD